MGLEAVIQLLTLACQEGILSWRAEAAQLKHFITGVRTITQLRPLEEVVKLGVCADHHTVIFPVCVTTDLEMVLLLDIAMVPTQHTLIFSR